MPTSTHTAEKPIVTWFHCTWIWQIKIRVCVHNLDQYWVSIWTLFWIKDREAEKTFHTKPSKVLGYWSFDSALVNSVFPPWCLWDVKCLERLNGIKWIYVSIFQLIYLCKDQDLGWFSLLLACRNQGVKLILLEYMLP